MEVKVGRVKWLTGGCVNFVEWTEKVEWAKGVIRLDQFWFWVWFGLSSKGPFVLTINPKDHFCNLPNHEGPKLPFSKL